MAVLTGGRGGSIVNNGNTFFPLKHTHISLSIIYNVFFISSMYLSLWSIEWIPILVLDEAKYEIIKKFKRGTKLAKAHEKHTLRERRQ